MLSAEYIYEVLEKRRSELGLSQAEVGRRAFGKADNSAFQSLRKGSSPSAEKLEALCEALGLILYMGQPRERIPSISSQVGRREVDAIQRAAREMDSVQFKIDQFRDEESALLQQAQEATQEFWKGLDPSNYVLVPLSKATLSAGAGASNPSEAIVDHLVFRQSWLRGLGVEPKHARLARVRGASMIPMIHDNDLVLIDTSKREVPVRTANPAKSILYALTQDGEARVKWVQRPDEKTLILHSENSALHPPEYYTGHDAAEVNVIGKVLWWGHSVRD